MPKKILLDVDPGVVDAMALCWAFFDPMVEIAGITSVGGNVPAPVAAKNLQAIVEFIDPPRLPRMGFGTVPDEGLPSDYRHVHGIDGLGGTPLPVAELRSRHPAEKVICDIIRDDPENVIVIAMGPLTNIARALILDPELPRMIRHLYITGGTLNARGNVTPCAEFNIYADPAAAKTVLLAPFTKTLIPLEVTNPVMFSYSDLEQLPGTDFKLGSLFRSMLIPAFQAYRQCYGIEGIHIHDLVTYAVAVHPELAETKELAVDVEIEGQLTRGMTVIDARPIPEWTNGVDVVTKINEQEILREILLGLNDAANQME
ncbi:MAG: nucleoside hydrolase [Planctomycetaceae bacterium]|jgi:inosine-uridine nucleoside N-ribohydrolase|nr:nucleoside hydrolase [Planctomycetaceae bacterium]